MPIRDWAVTTGSVTAILLGSMVVPLASAQAQEDAIARCRTAATAEARIACLEEALRDDTASEPAPQAPASEERERRGFRLPGLPFGDRDRGNDDTPAPVVADSAPAPAAEGLGSEQVNARRTNNRAARVAEIERETVDSAITQFEVIPYERLEITLANGQVWRQISADNQRVAGRLRSGRDYTATVQEGRMGGYQLRINEIARIIRVERIR